jgi:hypothetical protein
MKAVLKQKTTTTTTICDTPACPEAPRGCSFSSSKEQDENGCPKYPCGVNLVCDSGNTYEPTNAKHSKTLTNCIENGNPKACKNVCNSAVSAENSFLELLKRPKPSQDQSRANFLERKQGMTLLQLNAKEGRTTLRKGGKGGRRAEQARKKAEQEKKKKQNN